MRIGCEARAVGPVHVESRRRCLGKVSQSPREVLGCRGGRMAQFGVMSLTGKTVGSQFSGRCPENSRWEVLSLSRLSPAVGVAIVVFSTSQTQRPFPRLKGFRSCSVALLCFPCSHPAVPCYSKSSF